MAPTVKQEIERHLNDVHRVLLLNLLHDQRISPKREERLDALYRQLTGRLAPLIPGEHELPSRIRRSVREYYSTRIAVAGVPDYCDPVLNGNNFVPLAKPGSAGGIHPDTKFVNVIDLTKYAKAFQQAGIWGAPGAGATPQDVVERLTRLVPAFPERSVPGRPDGEVDAFVARALEVIFDYDQETRPGPSWVALWEQFRGCVAEGPNGWLLALGMEDSYEGAPRYPLVLVYRACTVVTPVRPTQLEAAANPLHFPSSPAAPLAAGGFAMDRSAAPGYREPFSEYVHMPRRATASDWILGGRLAGPTTVGASPMGLTQSRRRHYQRLRWKCPAVSGGWMRDVTCLA